VPCLRPRTHAEETVIGNLWLTWLADELEAAGLRVTRYEGWTTRARSSGGYGGPPLCVMWHHTASQTSPPNDSYYMCHTSGDRPIANLLVARDGIVWVLAAGATNTNGKGKALQFSRGSVPANDMNQWAVGMELANAGTGEPYLQEQIDAAFTVSNVINTRLGNRPSDVCTHQHYAPDRKIDPARGAGVQGPWGPREINSSGSWSLDDLVDECLWRCEPTPPPDEEDDMPRPAVYMPNDDPQGPWIWWDGERSGWVRDAAWLSVGRVMGVYSNTSNDPLKNFNKAQLKQMISQSWADSGSYPPGYGP
jgi:N-acetylmuramoyl-L-alanine amidase